MSRLERLREFLSREYRAFIHDALRPPATQTAPAEADLIERAAAGSPARAFVESPVVQDFMTRAEAQLTNQMLALPLDDDAGRRNLAAAVNATRGLMKYLVALSQDGAAAERELVRIRDGVARKEFF